MGYMHIDNLYRNQIVLLFKEVYAMEKIHGTSCSIRFDKEEDKVKVKYDKVKVKYFSGGVNHENFVKIFDEAALLKAFDEIGAKSLTIFGEGYGGKCQGMSSTYGKELKFVVFDIRIGDHWLDVPDMDEVAKVFGLEVVEWERGPATVEWLDEQRDRPSTQAERNGCGSDKLREGIVIRPIHEFFTKDGKRVIAKHKGDAFAERVHQPKVKKLTEDKLAALKEAEEIANEWVTPMRLTHVLDKLPQDIGIEQTKTVIQAMLEDIEREGEGEIEWSPKAKRAVGNKTAQLFKARLKENLK